MSTVMTQIEGLDTLVSSRLGGLLTQMQPVPGEVPVIQIVVESYESLPIYLTFSEAQCLCICYLWTESEIIPERRGSLMEALLDLNISVPLSSFGRIGEHYVLFGSLAQDSRINDIANDVVALLDNAVDALDTLSGYLN